MANVTLTYYSQLCHRCHVKSLVLVRRACDGHMPFTRPRPWEKMLTSCVLVSPVFLLGPLGGSQ